ncbi:phosphate ABC transporter permease subunit PstC [Candidatus Izemoplasma sp. B36]|uniref:phosphate ABC transporter permease subunit PstC n=1 Tax=Candidatus Izemoplasma sp. B36 TaxID=3242468 RepID=UPI0035566D13
MALSLKNSINIKKKNRIIDKITRGGLLIPTILSASFVILIVFFVSMRGVSPFLNSQYGELSVDFIRFISGTTWYISPNIYGIFYIIINTLYVVILAALLAVPVSIFTALFIAKMTPRLISGFFKTVVELLAAVPSIVFGVFGLGVITGIVKNIAELFGTQTAGGISTLSTVIVLAIMIIPTITLLAVTAINAVEKDLEENSLALGATKMQTLFKVTLVKSKSGIFAGIILGIGRALGEATAVSMVAGNSGTGPNFNIFNTTRTLTSTMLLGLKETTGLDYDIRFSVGIVLIVLIILTNLILNFAKKKIGRFS